MDIRDKNIRSKNFILTKEELPMKRKNIFLLLPPALLLFCLLGFCSRINAQNTESSAFETTDKGPYEIRSSAIAADEYTNMSFNTTNSQELPDCWLYRKIYVGADTFPFDIQPSADFKVSIDGICFSSENLLDTLNTELTICIDDAALLLSAQSEAARLTEVLNEFSAEDYKTGFFLYNLNSGGGISYHADDIFYCASTIKGPYVAWILQTYPERAAELDLTISNTIQVSSNEDYYYLLNLFGLEGFDEWLKALGCETIAMTEDYPAITAREFSLLWIAMYDTFTQENEHSAWMRELYSGTLNSCIYETLGKTCPVYSKAGWIAEGDYYYVQNDTGIVMRENSPYVLVILSSAYGRTDLLNELVSVLDEAHDALF